MSGNSGRLIPATALALAIALSGCGGTAPVNRIHGNRLTIYLSLPLEGASRLDAQGVLSAARLALGDISGRIGKYRIALRVLDDATVKADGWDPGLTETNARLAATDRTAIGYIGDFNSGATAISIPLLNHAGIAQISPTSTAVGLTTDALGASPGEPQKYYPTGQRTFVRVIPSDTVQADVQVKLERSLGCTKIYIVDDDEVDGLDMATTFDFVAKAARLNIVGMQGFPRGAANYLSFAASVATSDPDCVFISAVTESDAALVVRELAAALPHARLFGSASLADSTFTDPTLGGIPLSLDPRILITIATVASSDYPPTGRDLLARYARLFGPPRPYAVFGYEAMSLMLDAIARASDDGRVDAVRSQVVRALFATHDRSSVLGTYTIDANGDTTIRRYGVWRVIRGQLAFWRAIRG